MAEEDIELVTPAPRRRGVHADQAIFTYGREEEYRLPIWHPACTMTRTFLRHYQDPRDTFTRLIKKWYPYRDMVRSYNGGQFTGFWKGSQIDLHVTPKPSADDEDWQPTTPRMPAIRPRSPKVIGPLSLPDRKTGS